MKFLPFSPIPATVANATITSAAVDMSQIFKMSAQVIATAGANTNGSLQIQVSNDHANGAQFFQNQTFTHWSNLGSAVAVTSSAAVTLIAQQDMCYKALRAVYTDASSGTGVGTIAVQILCLSM